MSDSHTSGPWRVWSGSGDGHPLYIIANVYREWPRLAQMTRERPDELEANARLMAAAPALLAQCEKLADWFRRNGAIYDEHYTTLVREIAMAKGA